jgi:holo-[acyl-carrier protein] synthase
MIFGIGTDIVTVARIEAAITRHGDAFAQRILSQQEYSEFSTQTHPVRFLAKRFAAKEALAKATGQGLRNPVTLHNIEVGHDALGKPQFRFAPELEQHLHALGVVGCHLSISDEHEHAMAFVVLEQ